MKILDDFDFQKNPRKGTIFGGEELTWGREVRALAN